VILAAITLAVTPDGLRRILEATVGDHYAVAVKDGDPVVVGLRRRA
jgi:hypothetical protein